ncbi:MAG: isoprenylcysteine carboxylmethyltransferase family protein [Gemmatimonadota bacterium]|jgi:hypothetical protein
MSGSFRVGAAWALVVPFLVLARPTSTSVLAGGCLAAAGVAMRAWAAGSIDKGATLATGGPYAHTRNPLYLGSFVIGIGVALAGGHWGWPVAFALVFATVYIPTMRREAGELADRFGERYRHYATNVPAFSVRLSTYRPPGSAVGDRGRAAHGDGDAAEPGFSWSRYARYREWEAALGVLGLFGVLVVKVAWGG